jgi:hypothetical protein
MRFFGKRSGFLGKIHTFREKNHISFPSPNGYSNPCVKKIKKNPDIPIYGASFIQFENIRLHDPANFSGRGF